MDRGRFPGPTTTLDGDADPGRANPLTTLGMRKQDSACARGTDPVRWGENQLTHRGDVTVEPNHAHRAAPSGAMRRDVPDDKLALIAQRAVWEVRERTAALERSSHDLADLLAAMAHPDQADADLHVPAESLGSRRELLGWQSETELMIFLGEDWRQTVLSPDADPTPFSAAIARGVRVRVVVASSGLSHDVDQAVQMTAPGTEWRSVEHLPGSMIVSDRRTALLSEGPDRGAVLIRHASAALALSALFDAIWGGAATIHTPGASSLLDTASGTLQHQQLAALLASGATDEAIARALGISVRKLVRLIAAMRDDLGADTRFQLGVRAARAGLV